ncbi:hypothetical protein J7L49_06905 [Candidatus Bathyarchaeota archaeon]|nr:hypothetical protein [Candidatus Bathyarchaeota archaeon]
MSAALETPLQSAVNDLKTRLSEDLGITIYDCWPPMHGIKLPCISIYLISSTQREIGIGQLADDRKATLHEFVLQLNVWTRNYEQALELSDKIEVSLFQHRSEFGDYIKDVKKIGERWHGLEKLEELKGLTENKAYRMSMDVRVTYAVAEASS